MESMKILYKELYGFFGMNPNKIKIEEWFIFYQSGE
jgi:hypothetical protein